MSRGERPGGPFWPLHPRSLSPGVPYPARSRSGHPCLTRYHRPPTTRTSLLGVVESLDTTSRKGRTRRPPSSTEAFGDPGNPRVRTGLRGGSGVCRPDGIADPGGATTEETRRGAPTLRPSRPRFSGVRLSHGSVPGPLETSRPRTPDPPATGARTHFSRYGPDGPVGPPGVRGCPHSPRVTSTAVRGIQLPTQGSAGRSPDVVPQDPSALPGSPCTPHGE